MSGGLPSLPCHLLFTGADEGCTKVLGGGQIDAANPAASENVATASSCQAVSPLFSTFVSVFRRRLSVLPVAGQLHRVLQRIC